MARRKRTPLENEMSNDQNLNEENEVEQTEDSDQTQPEQTEVVGEQTETVEETAIVEEPVEEVAIVEEPVEEVAIEEVAEEVVEETVVETETTPEPEVEGIKTIELPTPKNRAGRKPQVFQKRPNHGQAKPALADITLEELIEHKHNFDLANASEILKNVISFLDRYEERMQNGVGILPDQGESLQVQLFKFYLTIFSIEDTVERNVAMEILLWKFFKNEKGAFTVTALARYTRTARWIHRELNMYLNLNNIFNMIKNPKDRISRLRQINLAAVVKAFPGEKARFTDNLINWATNLK